MSAFSDLEHKLIKKIQGLEVGSSKVLITLGSGHVYRMYHAAECCERVEINDISGDVDADFTDAYVGRAEENSNEDVSGEHESATWTFYRHESATWTFYRLDTSKGCIVIRWLGTSNGNYSESVAFEEVTS